MVHLKNQAWTSGAHDIAPYMFEVIPARLNVPRFRIGYEAARSSPEALGMAARTALAPPPQKKRQQG